MCSGAFQILQVSSKDTPRQQHGCPWHTHNPSHATNSRAEPPSVKPSCQSCPHSYHHLWSSVWWKKHRLEGQAIPAHTLVWQLQIHRLVSVKPFWAPLLFHLVTATPQNYCKIRWHMADTQQRAWHIVGTSPLSVYFYFFDLVTELCDLTFKKTWTANSPLTSNTEYSNIIYCD